ncbi:MAG: hypothetical protein JJE07_07315 [Flavobacteriaceae bacterium]|nr:hypothetical protein [Flavobacteriaceae bacterium]
MKNLFKLSTVIFSVLILFSCKDKEIYSAINNTTASANNELHKVVISESADGGTYTYLNVEENGNKYWMAIPNTEVKVGDTYYYNGGMLMENFESKQLEKTFDKIIFADNIRTTEKAPVQKQVNPHTNSDTTAVVEIKIEKAENGISLEELFTNKKSLSGKSIIVRGKVVKLNNAILDRNWVHIVDGTQFENKKSLTVTTKEMVKIGDTVTFKGIIVLEKDFGQGYIYDILLEEGELIN